MTDPQVVFISQLWRAPFQKVQFTVKASTPKVATFVQNTIKRFWRQSLPRLLARYFEFGFCAGGAEYEAFQGSVRLAKVKAVECRDVQPRVWKEGFYRGQFAGFMLTSAGPDSLSWVGTPHAFWFAGQERFGQFYDRPPLAGMFAPWLEKNGRGGAIHMRRLWFRKNAARGMEVRYPPGVTNVGSEENPVVKNNQDLAREVSDYHESNSTLILENTKLPDGSGEYEWDVKYAQGTADVAGFREYPKDLDEEMVKGAGIPLEVIQGSDSGSGYKGRLVSYGGFLGTVDELTGLILEDVEPWMKPLVRINYGPNAWYEIEPISLAQIASEEEKRQPTNPVGQPLASLDGAGGGGGGGGAGQFQPEGVKTGAPLPFDLSTTEVSPNGEVLNAIKGLAVAVLAAVKSRPAIEMSALPPAAAPAKPDKLGCAMIDLPPALADQVRSLAAKIPPASLAEKGCEHEPHVTIRHGLHESGPDSLRPILADAPPVRVRLGGVSVFPGGENGKPYDVLKIDVESAGLRRLNRELACLLHTDTHPKYCPHVTVAYVKAGQGAALAALAPAFNAEFVAKEVAYSDGSGGRYVLPLCGEGYEMAATATGDDVDPAVKEQVFNQTQQKLMRTRKSTIAQLLALAMLRKQQEATAAGKPEEAAGSLRALASLAGDPIQVARIVGMKGFESNEMSAADEEAFELAWTFDTGPRGGFYAESVEPGAIYVTGKDGKKKPKRVYGKAARALQANQAAGGTEKQVTARTAKAQANEVMHKLVRGEAGKEDLETLADALPKMRAADIRKLREVIKFNLRGERKRDKMVALINAHADQMVAGAAKGGAKTEPGAVAEVAATAKEAPAEPVAVEEKVAAAAPSEPAKVAPEPKAAKAKKAPAAPKIKAEKPAKAAAEPKEPKAKKAPATNADLDEYNKAVEAIRDTFPRGELRDTKIAELRAKVLAKFDIEPGIRKKTDTVSALAALLGKKKPAEAQAAEPDAGSEVVSVADMDLMDRRLKEDGDAAAEEEPADPADSPAEDAPEEVQGEPEFDPELDTKWAETRAELLAAQRDKKTPRAELKRLEDAHAAATERIEMRDLPKRSAKLEKEIAGKVKGSPEHKKKSAELAKLVERGRELAAKYRPAKGKSTPAMSKEDLALAESRRAGKKAAPVKSVIAAEVQKPVEEKKPEPAKKTDVPSGHTVSATHDGGAVVAKDPKSGDLTTRFAAGEPEKQAKKLAPAIAEAMDEAKLFPEAEDGLVPLGMLVSFVSRKAPGATRSDILAALSHMRATRQLEGHPLNEVQKLTTGGVSSLDESDSAKATLWDNGRAIHYWMTPANKLVEEKKPESAKKATAKSTATAESSPKSRGQKVDAIEKELLAEIELDKNRTTGASSEEERRAQIEPLIRRLAAEHSPAEIRDLAKRVTGKSVANTQSNLNRIAAKLTRVTNMVHGQDV